MNTMNILVNELLSYLINNRLSQVKLMFKMLERQFPPAYIRQVE